MGDITLWISPECKLKIFLSFLLYGFPMPAFVALLLPPWLVACTIGNRDFIRFGKVAPQTRNTSPSSRVSLWSATETPQRVRACSPAGNTGANGEAVEDWVGQGVCRWWGWLRGAKYGFLHHCNPISNLNRTVKRRDRGYFCLILWFDPCCNRTGPGSIGFGPGP